jgi:hypothetical protein
MSSLTLNCDSVFLTDKDSANLVASMSAIKGILL